MDPLDLHVRAIDDAVLVANGITVRNLDISAVELENAIVRLDGDYTRGVRYYVATQVLSLHSTDTVLDIGGGRGYFYRWIEDRVRAIHVCDLDTIDGKIVPTARQHQCSVFDLDVEVLSACKFYLGHTFEHLQGDDDIRLIRLLGKVMPAHGVVCIEPLFVGGAYLEVSHSPRRPFDARAQAVTTVESDFPGNLVRGMGFARVYDVRALQERVLDTVRQAGLRAEVLAIRANGALLPDPHRYAFKRQALNHPLRVLRLTAYPESK